MTAGVPLKCNTIIIIICTNWMACRKGDVVSALRQSKSHTQARSIRPMRYQNDCLHRLYNLFTYISSMRGRVGIQVKLSKCGKKFELRHVKPIKCTRFDRLYTWECVRCYNVYDQRMLQNNMCSFDVLANIKNFIKKNVYKFRNSTDFYLFFCTCHADGRCELSYCMHGISLKHLTS